MKKRPRTLTLMQILEVLRDGPRVPTRLAQVCNINYVRLSEFTDPLASRGLIRQEERDGQRVYVLTDEGNRLFEDWERIWARIGL